MVKIILASGSQHRAHLLKNAGIVFDQIPSTLDERAIEEPLKDTLILPGERAEILAGAKGIDVSVKYPDAMVIGCDQILSLKNEVLHKTINMDEARKRLIVLSGRIHYLHSAVSVSQAGKLIWQHTSQCTMTMRKLSPQFIGDYLASTGEAILTSVGAYQIEGLGSQLFEKIEGDFFSIVGLPLLPLLTELRKLDAIDG